MIRKIPINGIEFSFYEQNIFNDYGILISSKHIQLRIVEVKSYLDTFITTISDLIEVGAIEHERLEKYSTDLSVLKKINLVFSRKSLTGITLEMG